MSSPHIKILCVGTLKEKYWQSAVAMYSSDIRKWARLEIIEVCGEKVPAETNPALEKAVKDKEADALLKRITGSDYVVTLEIEGKPISSTAFGQLVYEKKDIVILIGGTLGLGDAAIRRRNLGLSFSGMTFPHQMMRVLLLEQISRYKSVKHFYI